MKKNVTVLLEPYWNISKYGIRNVTAVEIEDGVVNKMERDIELDIASKYPGIKKVKVSFCKYNPIHIVDPSSQSDNVKLRYSKIGFRVDLKFNKFMNADDVKKNVLETGKNYDITKITKLVEFIIDIKNVEEIR
jgi:hypothetical protein